jgi:hypothetical protein
MMTPPFQGVAYPCRESFMLPARDRQQDRASYWLISSRALPESHSLISHALRSSGMGAALCRHQEVD